MLIPRQMGTKEESKKKVKIIINYQHLADNNNDNFNRCNPAEPRVGF